MVLEVLDLKKSYKDFTLVVKEFKAGSCEIIGLVGNNGAGKTTFLRLLLDLVLPDSGKIFSNQISINQSDHWKEYTGSFLDEDFLIGFLSPMEFFEFIGKLYNVSLDSLKLKLLGFQKFLGIDLNSNKLIREYSAGNKYKIGIISTLITCPKILLLDEPFNYLDPTSQNILSSILGAYAKEYSSTIILSSHDLSHISELCTRIIIIDNGLFIKEIENSSSERTSQVLKSHFMV
jgi:ABC-2 type transport system ATP-binding protein